MLIPALAKLSWVCRKNLAITFGLIVATSAILGSQFLVLSSPRIDPEMRSASSMLVYMCAFVAAVSVWSALKASIAERKPHLESLSRLGVIPAAIMAYLVVEAAVITVAAVAVGVVLHWPTYRMYNAVSLNPLGIDLPASAVVNGQSVMMTLLLMLAMSVGAAFFAWVSYHRGTATGRAARNEFKVMSVQQKVVGAVGIASVVVLTAWMVVPGRFPASNLYAALLMPVALLVSMRLIIHLSLLVIGAIAARVPAMWPAWASARHLTGHSPSGVAGLLVVFFGLPMLLAAGIIGLEGGSRSGLAKSMHEVSVVVAEDGDFLPDERVKALCADKTAACTEQIMLKRSMVTPAEIGWKSKTDAGSGEPAKTSSLLTLHTTAAGRDMLVSDLVGAQPPNRVTTMERMRPWHEIVADGIPTGDSRGTAILTKVPSAFAGVPGVKVLSGSQWAWQMPSRLLYVEAGEGASKLISTLFMVLLTCMTFVFTATLVRQDKANGFVQSIRRLGATPATELGIKLFRNTVPVGVVLVLTYLFATLSYNGSVHFADPTLPLMLPALKWPEVIGLTVAAVLACALPAFIRSEAGRSA